MSLHIACLAPSCIYPRQARNAAPHNSGAGHLISVFHNLIGRRGKPRLI
jgi:hypothetical protein